MVPYIVATIGMIWWSRRSDRTGERKLHSALPLALAGVAMLGAASLANPVLSMLMITLALTGLYAFKAPFWSLPTLFLSRYTAAISVAVINSIGNLGGFVGPSVIGLIKGATGQAKAGLLFLSLLILVSFVMTIVMRFQQEGDKAESVDGVERRTGTSV